MAVFPEILHLVSRSVHPQKTIDNVIDQIPHLRQYWNGHHHVRLPTSRQLLLERYFPYLVVCHLQDPQCKVILDSRQHSRVRTTGLESVLKGHLVSSSTGNLGDVIVKYRDTRMSNVLYELEVLRRLSQTECPMYWFSSSFMFWTTRVLVRECLEPLRESDHTNINIIASDILNQLRYLHTFGVHNNIKPENICVRLANQSFRRTFFLVDYEGVATERLRSGFRRTMWTPLFASQSPTQDMQVTTPLNDLIELGYTLQYIKTQGRSIRNGFAGVLADYMSSVMSLNPHDIQSLTYDILIDIFRVYEYTLPQSSDSLLDESVTEEDPFTADNLDGRDESSGDDESDDSSDNSDNDTYGYMRRRMGRRNVHLSHSTSSSAPLIVIQSSSEPSDSSYWITRRRSY